MDNQAFNSSREAIADKLQGGAPAAGPRVPGDQPPSGQVVVPLADMEEITVTVTAVPLVDNLRMAVGDNQASKGPAVPPRRRSREHSREKIERLNSTAENSSIMEEVRFRPREPCEPDDPRRQSRGVQAWPTPPYRLKVIPRRKTISEGCRLSIDAIGRWAFCQIGLGLLLLIWAMMGATAFRYTEGPREEKAAGELVTQQQQLVVNLTQELRQTGADDSAWYSTIQRYMHAHEGVLASAGVLTTAPHGAGRVWTFPGCVLFAISLITTLGFGAPVPRTPEGRGVAVAFSAIGVPLHLLLVLNIGMAIAIKLQTYATRKQKSDGESQEESIDAPTSEKKYTDATKTNGIFPNRHRRSGSEPIGRQAISNISREASFMISDQKETKYFHITESDDNADQRVINKSVGDSAPRPVCTDDIRYNIVNNLDKACGTDIKISKNIGCEPVKMPPWLKWIPFVGIGIYYVIGVLVFGVARYKSIVDSLMFPLDFTVAGGVAQTPGYVRVLYGIFLEGAVVLCATTVSILQVSATEGLTDLGLKYGLLTNSR